MSGASSQSRNPEPAHGEPVEPHAPRNSRAGHHPFLAIGSLTFLACYLLLVTCYSLPVTCYYSPMPEILYRKWRPRDFAELAGQEHVTTTLTSALATGRIAHAYLF